MHKGSYYDDRDCVLIQVAIAKICGCAVTIIWGVVVCPAALQLSCKISVLEIARPVSIKPMNLFVESKFRKRVKYNKQKIIQIKKPFAVRKDPNKEFPPFPPANENDYVRR